MLAVGKMLSYDLNHKNVINVYLTASYFIVNHIGLNILNGNAVRVFLFNYILKLIDLLSIASCLTSSLPYAMLAPLMLR